MERKSRFRIGKASGAAAKDPESLFRDLKQRSSNVQYLWSHQADVLRTWHQASLDFKDIALELPTGTGKTLIGLLIAEYRRQTRSERVLYLSLTRQLSYQVASHAHDYGIEARVLVGDQTKYDPASYAAYASAHAIGLTTYSGVFNVNPRLKDAECLILDDAHSAEGHIADLWSVTIDRYDQESLYKAIIDVFRDTLSEQFLSTIENPSPDPARRRSVDSIPFPTFLERSSKLISLLEQAQDSSIRYPWTMVCDCLHACNIFIAWSSICIRPIIPPTLTHLPFASAKQRVYMSATLGAGGELERIIGVPTIQRLPAPEGWDRQSTGRRLFIMPGYALGEADANDVMWQSIGMVGRALVLCPDNLTARKFSEGLEKSGIDRAIMSARDIEESLDKFTSHDEAILLLAGRYDGLDLAGEACRLEVVFGLPAARNAQEQFLLTRLRAVSLLRDRIRTRLTQAFGRCTRGPTDYAAVLLIGAPLVDFCLKSEVRTALHPELQAELEYGIQQSAANTVESWAEMLQAFLCQEEDWKDAEEWIREHRDETTRRTDAVTQSLLLVAPKEVEYLYALWKGDYESALGKARDVADSLSGDDTAGYRAWWYYLAGSAALLVAQTAGIAGYHEVAKECFIRAAKCPMAVSWFPRLARMQIIREVQQEVDEVLSECVENIEEELSRLGLAGPKFEKAVSELLGLIKQDDHDTFVHGLEMLGNLLGFVASRPRTQGAPDCIWQLSEWACVAFEAKSEESPGDAVSVSSARQAKGHHDWMKATLKLADNATVVVPLISPRSKVAREALPHATGVCFVPIEAIRALAGQVCGMLRNVRARSAAVADEQLRNNIATSLVREKLDPKQLLQWMQKTRLKDLPQA